MKAYSLDLRQKIVAAVEPGGQTQKAVAQRFCVNLATVQRYMRLQREEADIKPKPAPGRVPGIIAEQEPHLRRLLETHPNETLNGWGRLWHEQTGRAVSVSALHRHMVRLGYRYKKRQKSPPNAVSSSERRS